MLHSIYFVFSSPANFRLWLYIVSHHSLLIRGSGTNTGKNIDIMFSGVFYQELRTSFMAIEFDLLTQEELERLAERCDRDFFASNKILVLVSEGKRYYVGASEVRIEENNLRPNEDHLLV